MGGDKAIFKLVVDEMVKVKEEYLVFDLINHSNLWRSREVAISAFWIEIGGNYAIWN